MGSFCQTCAITHMAIEYGDPVVGFVLGRSYRWRGEGVTGYVGAAPVWQALSLPFRGRYDDYGFVERIDRGFAPAALKAATGVDFDEIEKAAKSGDKVEIDLGNPYGKSRLMIMLVHADVFDALTAKTDGRGGEKKTFDVEASRVDEFMDAATRLAGSSGTMRFFRDPGSSFGDLSEFMESWTSDTGRSWTEMPEVASFFIRNRCDGMHPLLQRGMADAIGRMHGEGRIDEAREASTECLRSVFFDANLDLLRRQWQPQGGLGSQDTSYELHAEMAAITTRRCEIRSSDDYEGPDWGDVENGAASPAP